MPRPEHIMKIGNARLVSTLWGIGAKDPKEARDVWVRLRCMSLDLPMSRDARKRLEWFVDYHTKFKGNARKTCRYHGIAPKTFYYWKKRFDVRSPMSLEERSSRPRTGPRLPKDPDQTHRIVQLRTRYPYYSKMKLAIIYEREFGTKVSLWQIQKTIQRYKLYPDLAKARRIARNRRNAAKKRHIRECHKEPWSGWLFSIDTIVISVLGQRRYIITAIDHHSRFVFARAYSRHSSKSASDFLKTLFDIAGGQMQNVHTDNGSEFYHYFEKTVQELGLSHWWSRTHTPKDNATNERLNRTLQEEFLPRYKDCVDLEEFNRGLAEWLMEYNCIRPHAALGYKTPVEVASTGQNPFPMFRRAAKRPAGT